MKHILFLFLLSLNAYAQQYDLSTPENTLKSFYKCSETRDEQCALAHIEGIKRFQFNVPSKVISHDIKKKTIFTNKEVTKWNSKGIIPPAKPNDIQIDVYKVTLYNGKTSEENTYTYVLRKYNNMWKIYSWHSWGSP